MAKVNWLMVKVFPLLPKLQMRLISTRMPRKFELKDTGERVLFSYWYPMLWCKNPAPVECNGKEIVLPFPKLPEDTWEPGVSSGDDDIPEDWPSAEWKVKVGCVTCHQVYEYNADDVGWSISKKESQGSFHSGSTCYFAEFRCGNFDCKHVWKIYFDLPGKNDADLKRMLMSNYFQDLCPRGHSLRHAPHVEYRISRIVDRI